MTRSSGIPRSVPISGITRIVRERTSPVTISRPSESTGSMGQTETTTADHSEDLWLFDPRESVNEVVAGERVNGQLGALALDGADIQKDDRLTYGGVEYEVDTVEGVPEDNDADGSTHTDTSYFTVSLMRRNV